MLAGTSFIPKKDMSYTVSVNHKYTIIRGPRSSSEVGATIITEARHAIYREFYLDFGIEN